MVMHSVSDDWWVGMVEGALNRRVNCREGWLWAGRVMSIVEHNYVNIDSEGKRGDKIKGCS